MVRFNYNRCKTSKKDIIFLKLFLISLIFIILVIFLAVNILNSKIANQNVFADEISINASSYVVINANNNTVICGDNIHDRRSMASTTKIMTAILAIENLQLDKCIFINKNAIGVEGSSIYLSGDKKYKILDLIYGLMLRSGNDAAEALAYETSGSIEDFACLMNAKARDLNLKNTHFVNPHGLHDDNHYTSAYDLAIISAYAMKNPVFKEIVSSKIHIMDSDDGVFYNKNKLLSNYQDANGIKTGYTSVAGRCLVSSAERGGAQLIGVVLNCPDMWNSSMELLDYAFSKYDIIKIANKNSVIAENEHNHIYLKDDLYVAAKKNEKMNITTVIELNKLDIDIPKGGEIGLINIYLDNRLLFSKKIYTMEAVNNNEDILNIKSLVFEKNNGKD